MVDTSSVKSWAGVDFRPRGPPETFSECDQSRYSFSRSLTDLDKRLERWVAIKIVKAERTYTSRELDSLDQVAQHLRRSTEAVPIIEYLDQFIHDGPNGRHQCIVFELLGPIVGSLVRDYHEDAEHLPSADIFMIADRFLQAVAFLHSVGYAHGGK